MSDFAIIIEAVSSIIWWQNYKWISIFGVFYRVAVQNAAVIIEIVIVHVTLTWEYVFFANNSVIITPAALKLY